MRRMTGFSIVIASLICAAGCGGGGSFDSGSEPAATAAITSQNATVIAGSVASTAIDGRFLADLGDLATPVGAATGNVTVAYAHVGGAQTAEVSVGPEVQDCLESGTLSLSADIANPDTLTAGDSFSFVFSQCSQGDGLLIDGRFDFVVAAFEGDVYAEDFTLDIEIDVSNLRISDGSSDVTVDGDLALLLDTSTGGSTTVSITSDSLTMTSGSEFAALADYMMTTTVDPLDGTVSIDTDGYLMSSEFDGEVHFMTRGSLDLNSADEPLSGSILITGADGATIEMTLLGQDQVQLDVDVNGDGTVDDVIMTSWTALLS